ncbi:MAG: hypothetical protein GY789_10855 [Hyphomicrobiales bacterium]|nr:hypothetical protein [Hyphomicrobiales bacterium]
MTRSSQKEGERFFVENAAVLLGTEWCLGNTDRETPDFIVTEGVEQFGIEVVDIFIGPQDEHGSQMKRRESDTKKAVSALRHKYESKGNIPLIVKFVGDMCDENMAAVLPALDAVNLSTKPYGHHDIIEVNESKAKLRAHITRSLRSNWFSVNDRVGWVDRNPIDDIAKVIEKKSKKLPRYRECCGFDDIRLLIVANRIMSSGKLLLEEGATPDLHGFQAVYFFAYPENITIFD